MCFSISSDRRSLPLASTVASTLAARARSKRSTMSTRHRIAAAAPSLIGAHIGSVSGQEMVRAANTCSTVMSVRYCDSGLRVECR
jgi:hypothetical protein